MSPLNVELYRDVSNYVHCDTKHQFRLSLGQILSNVFMAKLEGITSKQEMARITLCLP